MVQPCEAEGIILGLPKNMGLHPKVKHILPQIDENPNALL